MTPQQQTARDTEAVILDTAYALYVRAIACHALTGHDTVSRLGQAIQAYDLIHAGTVHPAAYWPDLDSCHDPYDTGLIRAAGQAIITLGALIDQAPWLIGDTL